MPCTEFFGETSKHPGDSAPLQSRVGALWLLAFPKTKITFERDEIADHWWDSGKHDGGADGNWENGVRSWDPLHLRGLRCHCHMYNVSCVFFNKYLYLQCYYVTLSLCYMAVYFLDRPSYYYTLAFSSQAIFNSQEGASLPWPGSVPLLWEGSLIVSSGLILCNSGTCPTYTTQK